MHLYASWRRGWSYGLLWAVGAQLCPGLPEQIFSLFQSPTLLTPLSLWTSQVPSGSAQPASVNPVDCGHRDGCETPMHLLAGTGDPRRKPGPWASGSRRGTWRQRLPWDHPKQLLQTTQPPTSFKLRPGCLEISYTSGELFCFLHAGQFRKSKDVMTSISLMSFKMKTELWRGSRGWGAFLQLRCLLEMPRRKLVPVLAFWKREH